MAPLYILGFIAVIIISLYIYFTWTFDHWKRLNIPFEPPTVLFGNMTFILRENMSEPLNRLYKKFENYDYFGFWVFRTPTLVVRSPEYVREVLVAKFNCFSDRPSECAKSDPLGVNSLYMLKGSKWTQIRQRLTPVFTKSKIRKIHTDYVPFIVKELADVIDQNFASVNKQVDVKNLYLKYMVEVIAATVFGVRANSMQDDNAPFFKVGLSFIHWSLYRGIEYMSIFFCPDVAKFCRFKFFTSQNTEYMRSILKKTVSARENNPEKSIQKKEIRDLVDALIQLSKAEGDSAAYSEDDILAQAAFFFFAGFETTSTTLSFLTYHLAFHPEIQELLYEQIKAMENEGANSDDDNQDKLKLLEMCIKESLRLYPVLPGLDRTCTKDCRLPDGFLIKKGTRILVCATGLHHDENYFPQPFQWNPYRFEDEKNIKPFTYIPFGEGKRNCIGAKFGMENLKWTMVALIKKFRFETSGDTILPQNIRLNPLTFLNSTKSPLFVRFVRR